MIYEVTFNAKEINGKYYTLDGGKETILPRYSKHIKSIDELSKEEQKDLLGQHVDLMKQARDIQEMVRRTYETAGSNPLAYRDKP